MQDYALYLKYQEANLAYEEHEKTLRDTPTRRKLVNLQKFLQQCQVKIAEYEETTTLRKKKLSQLDTEDREVAIELDDVSKDLSYLSEAAAVELDQKEITNFLRKSEKLFDRAANVKKNASLIRIDSESDEKVIQNLFLKMRAAKKEYDELREVYQKEAGAHDPKLAELKTEMIALEKHVPSAILKEYKRIKGFKPNPIAVLKNSRCMGCNLQLPSSISAKILANEFYNCENCGRILVILPEEEKEAKKKKK